jgi:hypothetical protein
MMNKSLRGRTLRVQSLNMKTDDMVSAPTTAANFRPAPAGKKKPPLPAA